MEVQGILCKRVCILNAEQGWVNTRQICNVSCFFIAERYQPLQISAGQTIIIIFKTKGTSIRLTPHQEIHSRAGLQKIENHHHCNGVPKQAHSLPS